MPVPRLKREESQARTRELLLEAGRAQVVARGFTAASVRDIAEAAGFSQGAFYSNFASKEELLLELLRRQKESEIGELSAALDTSDPGAILPTLEGWVRQMGNRREWAILAVEMELHAIRNPQFGAEYSKLARDHLRLIGKLVQRVFDAVGQKPPLAAEQLAAGFVGLAHGLTLQRPKLPDAAWGAVYIAFVRGLVGEKG